MAVMTSFLCFLTEPRTSRRNVARIFCICDLCAAERDMFCLIKVYHNEKYFLMTNVEKISTLCG